MARPRKSDSTIGNDPFAAVIPLPAEPLEPVPPASPAPATAAQTAPTAGGLRPLDARRAASTTRPNATVTRKPDPPREPAAEQPRRQKLTVHLDGDVVNRVKNAAYWNPRLTIARIAERGIRKALEEVERDHGGPYPQRESELIGGHPIK